MIQTIGRTDPLMSRCSHVRLPVTLLRREKYSRADPDVFKWWIMCSLSAANYNAYGVLPELSRIAKDLGIGTQAAMNMLHELENFGMVELVGGDWVMSDWKEFEVPIAGYSDNPDEIRRTRLATARALGTHTSEQWTALLNFCGNQCGKCGAKGSIHKDHILPLHKGGSDSIENLQPLCVSCNCSKQGDSTDYRPRDWREIVNNSESVER